MGNQQEHKGILQGSIWIYGFMADGARVQGLRFMISGLGRRVWGFRDWGLRLHAPLQVQGQIWLVINGIISVFWGLGLGLPVSGLRG